MARSDFGGTGSDIVLAPGAGGSLRLSAATLTFWTAKTGGTQHADLRLNGAAVSIITVGTDGQIPLFSGPDGITSMWADAGGARVLMVAPGSGGSGGGVTQASEAALGGGEIATQTETNTGLDDLRFVTPLKLRTFSDARYLPSSDPELGAFVALTSAANKLPYFTGSGTAALADLTTFARTVLDDPDAATARATLGIDSAPIRFSASTATVATTATDRAGVARTIISARMRVSTTPAGSALTVVVQHSHDGTTWTDVTTLTVAAGSTTEAVSGTLSQAQVAGDLLRLNVTSVGSTTAAKGVVVDVYTA